MAARIGGSRKGALSSLDPIRKAPPGDPVLSGESPNRPPCRAPSERAYGVPFSPCLWLVAGTAGCRPSQ